MSVQTAIKGFVSQLFNEFTTGWIFNNVITGIKDAIVILWNQMVKKDLQNMLRTL